MTRSPRLVATDLDGTLVRSDGTISERSRAALARVEAAGATLVFVTGRPPRWMGPIVEATGHRGLAICANGALVYDLHREQVVAEHPLEPQAAAALVAALRRMLPELTFAVERANQFGREPGYAPRWTTPPDAVIAVAEELVRSPLVKLLARHEHLGPDELLARAREVISDDLATLTYASRDGLLEISGAGVSKASALQRLARERGIPAVDVIAFGDMPNDLPMLAWAGRSVAVAGAHPEVVAAVDEVTAGSDEDGVAQTLERLFPA